MFFNITPSEFLILIVDDTEANVRLLSHVLRGVGFQPIVAFNGTDAIELITHRKPDLVLLDIMMPDMTGYEVSKEIMKEDELKTIPIIFLSALSETSNKVEGFESGGVDYITKPFQKDEILARIKTHLFLAKLQKERDERIEIFRKRELELSELNRKKDDLVRMVSHDIKNPLTGIVGLANLIKKNPEIPQKDQLEMLLVMESSGQKLLDLVEKMLDNEDSNNTASESTLIEGSLEDLVEKVVSVNRPKAILKKINLLVEKNILLDNVLLDHTKIEIALNNLVSNALKFTPKEGAVILTVISDANSIQFTVSDTGIGIPQEIVDSLFKNDGFKNNSKLGTDGEIGTGLGLDVVEKYILLHNGQVTVESQENEGTTFYIKIPVKK